MLLPPWCQQRQQRRRKVEAIKHHHRHHPFNAVLTRYKDRLLPASCQHRRGWLLAGRTMRRADRLFQIIQVLRRTRNPLTADAIAAELETSKRTIYRDIATLIGQRVPIRGEAGMGYILEKGFDLPPLMLTPDEIEAAVLGAQWVAGNADPVLARAAEDLKAKIADTVPERLRPFVLEPASGARPNWRREPDRIDMARTRSQIHEGKKIALRYRDEHGRDSERTIWPIAIGYHEAVRLLAAWCELRKDFRSFRTDRVIDANYLEEKYPERRDVLRAKWRQSMVWERPKEP